ncbi:thiamine-phosphate kinase [Candidatus Nitrotoga sp. M5]|uniref:thiamine-phosphate kinase n=1 Tax=Candidatus Nitrotoga sp. M5 TaxID=2890409 RepID=UPI001EF35651|nr:thiamine-phosphate kinase [Candidatus Nitrotoga sp. M5]CAH1385481.1 thiamine monophosphate kinase [Candidatus Nitrotoga sp. M5]
MVSEFDLIRRFFTRSTPGAMLGVGDDAALLRVGSGMELAVSTDMLVSGTHFFPDTNPFSLGYKALAVNLSDMAAMAAQPRWATLALSLPEVDEMWLEKFSAGLFALADEHHVELIGGDTTRGPLNLCITIMGEVPRGAALRRSGAQVGDDVWVSGVLGDAALALAHVQGHMQLAAKDFAACTSALHQPVPRVALGLALRGVAHCAIDISDGLLADLGHILKCSNVGAEITFNALPASSTMQRYLEQSLGKCCVLAGGDDYELCFTVSVEDRSEVEKIAANLGLLLTRIGTITAEKQCIVRAADGSVINIEEPGYDHFR